MSTLAVTGGTPSLVSACTPYEIADSGDWFHLAHGVTWAAAAVVTDQIEDRTYPYLPPVAVVLTIQDTFAGDPTIRRLSIKPTDGCHPFSYHRGDHVIAAIGREVRSRPPLDGLDNFSVAVWVIQNGRVDASRGIPLIDGRAPTTEDQVRAWLMDLPDTATVPVVRSATSAGSTMWLLGLGALFGALLGWRRALDSRRSRSGRRPVG